MAALRKCADRLPFRIAQVVSQITKEKMEIHKKKMFVTFFWIIGMLYTGHNLVENYKQFKSYPALQINKFDGNSK